jgi:predicted kinase
VLDASWSSAEERREATALAESCAALCVPLRCDLDAERSRIRLSTRGPTPSDADATVARLLRDAADPWPEACPMDTAGPLEDTLDHALRRWDEAVDP